MAIKKSDLYSSIWAACDQLRGGMDASQYKDYVLFMLFIKYISDKYSDSKAFKPPVIIPPGAGFQAMVGMKGKDDIGDRVNKEVIAPLVQANDRLRRTDFPDFNDPNKLGEGAARVKLLESLIGIFQNPALDFSHNRAENDDILGDAYEYLMRHFATESGKSKGQFYTPAEVSRVIAQVIGISSENTVAKTTAYDPTCGSGSLLLKVAAQAGKQITLEGQEKDVTTAGLARMNMILHDFPTANVQAGNTLAAPKFKEGEALRTYDYVVANPPFSDKAWSTGLTPANDAYDRFAWGVPPSKQGDYAYLLHIVRSMKREGKAACILPHGVLFRGNAEAVIRRSLVDSGYLKGIIGLPANLFYGTGIPACILVLDKENAIARKGIFMIDASKGFKKDGNKNRLREQDIHRIVDTFTRQVPVLGYSRMVPVGEVADAQKNDYNLNLPRYIPSTEAEDIQDIEGHMRGGIPQRDLDALEAYWAVMPELRAALLQAEAGRAEYFHLRLPMNEVKAAILNHEEFTAFNTSVTALFDQWRAASDPVLKGFAPADSPKQLIEEIAENLLAVFEAAPLLDAYDVYQHLMDCWAEVMQDDCYLLSVEGWVAQPYRITEEIAKGKKKGELKDKGWVCDLVPKPLMVARYFAAEQAEIDRLQGELEAVEAEKEALSEEYGGEEGVLKDVSSKTEAQAAFALALVVLWGEEDQQSAAVYGEMVDEAEGCGVRLQELQELAVLSALKNGKGNLTLKAVKNQLDELADNAGGELAVLAEYLELDKQQKQASKKAKELLEAVRARFLARLAGDGLAESLQELKAVVRFLALLDLQTGLRAQIKAAEAELDAQVYERYARLSEDEVRVLVVDDKWMAVLSGAVRAELDRVSQTLTGRIRELAERYAVPLPELVSKVEEIAARVDGHLRRMGAEW